MLLAQPVSLVLKVLRVSLVQRVFKVKRDLPVQQVLQGPLVQLALQVLQVRQVHKVSLDHKDLPDLSVLLVYKDRQALRDLRDLQESPVFKVRLVYLVPQ